MPLHMMHSCSIITPAGFPDAVMYKNVALAYLTEAQSLRKEDIVAKQCLFEALTLLSYTVR